MIGAITAVKVTSLRKSNGPCEATTDFSGAPSMDNENVKLRGVAVSGGANAIIQVEYHSGMPLTSWHSMTGTGLAITNAV